ncbi:MAG: hypothetical protein ABSF26_17705 [Thermoguttaceae bacterium]|jgi:hypothetical protein
MSTNHGNLRKEKSKARRRIRPDTPRSLTRGLCLEWLEERSLLSVVTPIKITPLLRSDNDPGFKAFTVKPGVKAVSVWTLRDAVIEANAHPGADTIQLQAGTYSLTLWNTKTGKRPGKIALSLHEQGAARGDLGISDDLTIQGVTGKTGAPATIINQKVLDRVFQILGGHNVTLKNLVIQGGTAVDDGSSGAAPYSTDSRGGGILSTAAAQITLSNVVIQNNAAVGQNGSPAYGGGIEADGGTLSLDSTVTFATNQAQGGNGTSANASGGAAQGGGLWTGSETVSLSATAVTNFLNNTALGGAGAAGTADTPNGGWGGLAVGGAALVRGSSAATAAFGGGPNVGLAKFSGNVAWGGAGGAGAPGGAGGDGGQAMAGAVYASSEPLTLAYAALSGNQALGGAGANGGAGAAGNHAGSGGNGGMVQGGAIFTDDALTFNNDVNFTANTAWGGGGGGGGADSSGGSAGSGGNGGWAGGGALLAYDSLVTYAGPVVATITNNQALGGAGGAGGHGGAGGNGGTGGQGGPAIAGALGLPNTAGNILTMLFISHNAAQGGAGGTGGAGGSGGNDAAGGTGGTADGGGAWVYDATIFMSNFTFNSAIGGAGGNGGGGSGAGGPGGEADGGGLFVKDAVNANLCQLSGNSAAGGNGGGTSDGLLKTGLLRQGNSTSGKGYGGGAYVDSLATLTITNSLVDLNTASTDGGGVYSLGTFNNPANSNTFLQNSPDDTNP